MPGYEKAVNQLKEDIQIDSGKKNKEIIK
jgi:hypothetical protein